MEATLSLSLFLQESRSVDVLLSLVFHSFVMSRTHLVLLDTYLAPPEHDSGLAVDDDVALVRKLGASLWVRHLARERCGVSGCELQHTHTHTQ